MAYGTCSIESCGKVGRLTRGWCGMHYQRWRQSGDPNKVAWIMGDDVARFWGKVEVRGPDECWPWKKRVNHGGYGAMQTGPKGNRKGHRAHRFAYEISTGPIPDGCQIDHTCHVPEECTLTVDCPHRRCCNPAHLKPATPRENVLRGNTNPAANVIKTHCPQDHPYDEVNTRINPRGARVCRACQRDKARIRQATNEGRAKNTAWKRAWRERNQEERSQAA